MANKTYIYCGSNDMSIMKLCLSTAMLPQFEMVTLLLGHPVYITIYPTSLIKYMGNLLSCCGLISKHVYPLELPKVAPFCMKITKNNSGGGPPYPLQSQFF